VGAKRLVSRGVGALLVRDLKIHSRREEGALGSNSYRPAAMATYGLGAEMGVAPSRQEEVAATRIQVPDTPKSTVDCAHLLSHFSYNRCLSQPLPALCVPTYSY
jgi:hypothetical protein